MPTYKLTYFNFWGRGGFIRLLFAAGGIEYEDVRIEREQWPELKPKTPMGQMPILEVDGTTICQSMAIGRLVAKEAGLAGKTPLEEARADMIVDGIGDVVVKVVSFLVEQDAQKKEEKKKEFAEKTLPPFLEIFEKLASTSGYFVGDALTWADVQFFSVLHFLKDHYPDDFLTGYVNLSKVRDNVTTNPGIAEFMKKEAAQ